MGQQRASGVRVLLALHKHRAALSMGLWEKRLPCQDVKHAEYCLTSIQLGAMCLFLSEH